jgi:hypothetical protein
MFTRQHYQRIAEILRRQQEATNEDLTDVAKQLALYFKEDNPRFDRARFLRAAGVLDEAT